MLILVTGTSAGIGRGLAERLIEKGHNVLGCSRRPGPQIAESYKHFKVDLASAAEIKAMFFEIRQEYGFLDALINNAGAAVMNPFLLTPDAEIERLFGINVLAMFRCTREAAKLMQKSEASPSILNLSTVAVPWSIPGQSVYAASKSAVEQATRSLAQELAAMKVRINTIGLPPVRTAMTRSVKSAKIDLLIERQAIKRMCTIDDILGPVEFLLSPAAGFVTGETLFLGGVC